MKKIKLIAELCQNHQGSFSLTEEMIHAAKENGADFVKIQSMRSKDLNIRKRFEDGLTEGGVLKCRKRPFKSEYERLKKLDLSVEEHMKFIDLCKKYKIKPMTTIFSRNRIQLIKKMNLEYLKLSSFDCASHAMIEEILAKINSNLIISTGGALNSEIETTAKILKKNGRKFVFLHCISIYPTTPEVSALSRIKYLKKFVGEVGFSDHSNPDVYSYDLSAISKTLGATWFERHFTILKKKDTKDGVVSVNPKQLSELRIILNSSNKEIIRQMKKKYKINKLKEIIGSPYRELTNEENLNRDYYRGRFVSYSFKKEKVYNWDKNFKYNQIKQV